ncbi:hypothetical protein ACIOD2_18015 [Amycolatopsis sp. NPDC088138]|uniref:hypothetical protein n=1 Tax=Amycolatopsis sp. NPDC088138 TaxID=3363938 RepID=UPI00380F6865
MNEQARWWSQPFPPTGAITSEGIRNQLGRPPVDPLTVFVRETVQNSWDARLRTGPVTYRLEIDTVAAAQRPVWERLLTPAARVERHLGVGRVLREPPVRLLTVSDRGTAGLGGPTRADELTDGRRDWISFVLNVGEKRDTEQGGGTYGYGKAVLYRLSKVGTVLVYTRTSDSSGQRVSRLIGIALGASFELREHVDPRPYTGRHWWGRVEDEHVEPLTGDEADQVARSLGLRVFAPGETGTTLVVVAPELDEFEDATSAGHHLAETIAWHTWPLMLDERGDDRLVPQVRVEGTDVPVPDPAASYPLNLFVKAYRSARLPDAEILKCGSPKKDLGRFSLAKRRVLPMEKNGGTKAAAYAGVPDDPHHVCLMRSPELVVRYFEGPETFSTNVAYAGVFRAMDELDEVYSAAEPPTHDNWVHEQLQGANKTFVRTTFTRIKERLADFKRPETSTPPVAGLPLGSASRFLGGLIAAAYAEETPKSGPGPAKPPGSGKPSDEPVARRARVRGPVTMVGAPVLEELAGEPLIFQQLTVGGTGPVALTAKLTVMTVDGREDEAPVGAVPPSVHSWRTPAGEFESDTCFVIAPVEVELRVRSVPDTLIDVAVEGLLVEEAS